MSQRQLLDKLNKCLNEKQYVQIEVSLFQQIIEALTPVAVPLHSLVRPGAKLTNLERNILQVLLDNLNETVPLIMLIDLADVRSIEALWVHKHRMEEKLMGCVIETWNKQGYKLVLE